LRRVLELEPCETATLAPDVLPVLLSVGGVDDQQVLVLVEAVQVGVVDRPARRRGHHGVLRLANLEAGGVVGEHVLEERQGVGPAQGEASHVRDVEETRPPTRRQVLADDARWILDGHLPAGELDQLRAGRRVAREERRARKPGRRHSALPSTKAFSLLKPVAMRSASMPE
jgi:hypothetical protein